MSKSRNHRFPNSRRRLRAALALSLAFLIAGPASAGTIRFDRDGLNARRSLSFRGTGNVITTVPKGTTGDVLERWELPSGNFGVKLKIAKLGHAGTTLQEGEVIWVYYHRDVERRRVAVVDDAGEEKEIDDASAKWAVALSSFKTRRPEPTARKELPCASCATEAARGGTGAIAGTPLAREESGTAPAEEIVEAVDDAPTMDVAEQEALAYIDRITEPRTAAARERNAKIAELTVREAKLRGVSVDLVLANMQAESEFSANAKSGKGARGLLQVMPGTYRQLIKEMGFPADPGLKLIYQPERNIQVGVYYMAKLLKKYGGDRRLAMMAYNGGDGWLDGYLRGRKAMKSQSANHWRKVSGNVARYAEYRKRSQTLLASR